MRLRWLLAATWSIGVVIGADAFAQTPDTHSSWTLTLRTLESSDSNVRFAPGGRSDLSRGLGVGLDRRLSFPRGAVGLSGDLTDARHRDANDLDHLTYKTAASASYQLTRRASVSVDNSFSRTFTEEAAALARAGLTFPMMLTRINTLTGAFVYAVSPLAQVRWELRDERISFDSGQFAGGSTLSSRAAITRRIGRNRTAGVSQEYHHVTTHGEQASMLALHGTLDTTVGRVVGVTVAGGAWLYTPIGTNSVRATPSGSVGLKTPLGRRQALGARYTRSVDQAFGFGRLRIADIVSLNYRVTVGRRFGFDATGDSSRSVDPADQDFRFIGRAATVGISYFVFPDLTVVASCSYGERADGPIRTVSNNRGTLSLTYSPTWR